MNTCYRRAILLTFIAAICFAAQASAQDYKVELTTTPAPQELSAPVRETLSPQALRVSSATALICEVWIRKAVPGATPAPQLGVIYPQLQTGTLVGVMRLAADVKDYRRAVVKAGVYTLRYALSPVNGNHQGVAPQRDFLLAIPAATDQDPANVSESAVIEMSKKSTTTNHASVWSLAPGVGAAGAPPAITHDGENDLWIVQFGAPIATGGAAAPVRMGLVVIGFGPEV
jgi:hypothetical protein